jgi:hypothetical protein
MKKFCTNVQMISAEAPVLFAKAAEIFIHELTMRAWIHTEVGFLSFSNNNYPQITRLDGKKSLLEATGTHVGTVMVL